MHLNNKEIELRLAGVSSRGDRKAYANGNNGMSQIKDFFISDLHLNEVINRNDYFAILENGIEYYLYFVPNELYDNFIRFFTSVTPHVNIERVPSHDSNNDAHESKQIIFYGAPGTGKSFKIKEQTEEKDVIRTTFHPDSDYSTFVGCYKPTTKEIPMRDVTGKVIIENGEPVTENRIVYEFVEQAFLQAYTKAWKRYASATEEGKQPEDVFLVIEEINRGNCAQIFGDLFQLLDRGDNGLSEYPIMADKDLQKQLAKAFEKMAFLNAPAIGGMNGEQVAVKIRNGEILALPPNLYIWATMNTSDQSLFPIDSAFKRRWDWQYVPIANAAKGWTINVNGKRYDWWDFLVKINALIGSTTNSEDKKLGYFFCKTQNGTIDADSFVGKVIFYLWNDVFKDFEFEGEVFLDEDKETKLTFDKFYMIDAKGKTIVHENKVDLFLTNLEVRFAENNVEDEDDFEDEDSLDNDEANNSSDGKDRSRYSINHQGEYNKRKLAFECVKLYVENHPELTAQEVVDTWMGLNLKLSNFVETAEGHETRANSVNDIRFEMRYYQFTLPNGEIIFVNNQFNVERINDFIEKVNAQNWDIHIEKIGTTAESIPSPASNSSSQRFYVEFPDGSMINAKTSIETFAQVIERIGVERVAELGLKVSNHPLLSKDKLPENTYGGYGLNQRRIGDYWMVCKFSNDQKMRFLQQIKQALNLDMEIKL